MKKMPKTYYNARRTRQRPVQQTLLRVPCESCAEFHEPLKTLAERETERAGVYAVVMVCPHCASEKHVSYTSDALKEAQAALRATVERATRTSAGMTRGIEINIRRQQKKCQELYAEINGG